MGCFKEVEEKLTTNYLIKILLCMLWSLGVNAADFSSPLSQSDVGSICLRVISTSKVKQPVALTVGVATLRGDAIMQEIADGFLVEDHFGMPPVFDLQELVAKMEKIINFVENHIQDFETSFNSELLSYHKFLILEIELRKKGRSLYLDQDHYLSDLDDEQLFSSYQMGFTYRARDLLSILSENEQDLEKELKHINEEKHLAPYLKTIDIFKPTEVTANFSIVNRKIEPISKIRNQDILDFLEKYREVGVFTATESELKELLGKQYSVIKQKEKLFRSNLELPPSISFLDSDLIQKIFRGMAVLYEISIYAQQSQEVKDVIQPEAVLEISNELLRFGFEYFRSIRLERINSVRESGKIIRALRKSLFEDDFMLNGTTALLMDDIFNDSLDEKTKGILRTYKDMMADSLL